MINASIVNVQITVAVDGLIQRFNKQMFSMHTLRLLVSALIIDLLIIEN